MSLASKRYLVTLKMRGYSPETIKCRKIYYRHLSILLNNPDIDKVDLEKLHRLFIRQHLQNTTIFHYLKHTQMLLRYFELPSQYDLPKTQETERPYLARKEVMQIIDKIGLKSIIDYRDRALIYFLFDTGLRISEALNLTRESIDLENGIGRVRQKGGGIRPFYLTRQASKYLLELMKLHQEDELFFGLKGNSATKYQKTPFRRSSALRVFKERAGAAGIKKKVGLHSLRHSFAFDLLLNGCDILTLQRLMGHKAISSTMKYVHLCDNTLYENYHLYKSAQTTYEVSKKRGLLPGFKIKLQIIK